MTIVLDDHSCRTAPETQPIPLPSPHLIAIHAAAAKILEESGARILILFEQIVEFLDGQGGWYFA
jgi:hypothetical protein